MTSRNEILIAGSAAWIAGAMSMAAGEYVSVSSQADTERADIARERTELESYPEAELRELTGIYMARGLSKHLAAQVAEQLMKHDALGAHARDELGISLATAANPVQAALASFATFTAGALLPLIAALAVPAHQVLPAVGGTSVVLLAILGAVGARAGGAGIARAVIRVVFWGILAMLVTAGVGHLTGSHV